MACENAVVLRGGRATMAKATTRHTGARKIDQQARRKAGEARTAWGEGVAGRGGAVDVGGVASGVQRRAGRQRRRQRGVSGRLDTARRATRCLATGGHCRRRARDGRQAWRARVGVVGDAGRNVITLRLFGCARDGAAAHLLATR